MDVVGQDAAAGPPRRNEPDTLVGIGSGSGDRWRRRPRRRRKDRRGLGSAGNLGGIDQSAERPDSRCSRDGTGTQAQRSTGRGKAQATKRHIAVLSSGAHKSHAEFVGNMAVTFCQRNKLHLVQSAKYVTLFRMTS